MLSPLVRFERNMGRLLLAVFIVLMALAFFAGRAHAQAAPTLAFTAELTRGSESVTPKLSWNTIPAASSCTASGDPAWTGTKAATGSATLATINTSKTYALVCTWPGDVDVSFRWTPPTTYTNNAPLTVAQYTIAYGTSAADVGLNPATPNTPPATVKTITVPAPATSYDLASVGPPGTYYFCGRAWDAAGLVSDCVRKTDGTLPSKVATAGASQTRSVSITVDPKPSPMSGFVVE